MKTLQSESTDPSCHVLSVAQDDPGERLHDRFMRQAVLTPDATAVIHAGRHMSYRELDERSNRIGHLLRGVHVGPGALVGICLDRGVDLVAALIAVLKAGAAYVPLDPAYPLDRLNFMLADSAAEALITSNGGFAFAGAVIDLDDAALAAAPSIALAEQRDAAALACVFYTSGSTGRPKGVMLRHTATAFIRWAERTFTRDEVARVAATTSICFDPSMFEIFAPLSLGGTVILKRDLLEPFAADERPTLLNGVPSAFAELVKENRIPGSVRVINVGGERLSASLARAIHRHAGDLRLWNHYGPTETTICASVALVQPDAEADPTIGQPIAGARFYVLDEAGRPVLPGACGELYIGGSSVAVGYLNQPDLTAERFLPDPFSPGGRMYRTGDMVRATKTGDLVFVGRQGRQIKFRGFRIELDEIEAALTRIPGIGAAAVLTTHGQDGQVDGLKAVIASSTAWSLPDLRRSLRDVLPRHMLPNKLVVLPALPQTPSGKIDRQTLERLEPAAPARLLKTDPWLPPLTETILTVFRTVLNQPAMSEQDDFFDHGGDSMLAMDTMMQLEALLGQPVPGHVFAQASSAETLGGLLPQQQAWLSSSGQHGQAILLQRDGAGAPLFCLADTTNRPLRALALALHFRGERPVWLLPPDGGAEPSDQSAPLSDQVATIRGRRTTEPVLLLAEGRAGQAGALLARQLEAQGATVVLILVEPVPQVGSSRWWHRIRDAVRSPDRDAAVSGPPFRGLTIVVEAASAGMPGQARRSVRGRIERVILPASSDDLMREPTASLLASMLRGRLRLINDTSAARAADILQSTGDVG